MGLGGGSGGEEGWSIEESAAHHVDRLASANLSMSGQEDVWMLLCIYVYTNGRLKGRMSALEPFVLPTKCIFQPLFIAAIPLFCMGLAELVLIPDLSEAADGAILTLELS